MDTVRSPTALLDALTGLRRRVAAVRLGLDTDGSADARRSQAELVGQIDDYLLPRLRQIDAPLLMVVGGSTGAGKSTLVNSLVGADVSTAGVLRPTTRAPVIVCNPADRDWFADDRVLPGLARATGAAADARALQLVPHPAVPPGLAILDAPDIDSVVRENRELAGQLLAAADLWLFVTTAARYADAVPWQLLQTARARSTALAVVLNRVPPGAGPDVSEHLGSMLRDNGLGDAALFTIEETS
ncbi:MAG TPA: dynamin family protein, partial [Mycobacteriales bacterium]|nr:dynamin family protein [Mycobacteriales bacterium]